MKPKLFYDGGCPLCRKEINHYIKIDRQQRVEWIDITQNESLLQAEGLTFAQTMRLIHAVDIEGNRQIGVPAFLVIWDQLPGYHWLARAVRATRMTQPLNWLYYRFANWRYDRRCKSGCSVSPD